MTNLSFQPWGQTLGAGTWHLAPGSFPRWACSEPPPLGLTAPRPVPGHTGAESSLLGEPQGRGAVANRSARPEELELRAQDTSPGSRTHSGCGPGRRRLSAQMGRLCLPFVAPGGPRRPAGSGPCGLRSSILHHPVVRGAHGPPRAWTTGLLVTRRPFRRRHIGATSSRVTERARASPACGGRDQKEVPSAHTVLTSHHPPRF